MKCQVPDIPSRLVENIHNNSQFRPEAERLKVAERDQEIASMPRTIEELQRKAEQGSQQLQGEVQEVELEDLLQTRFPDDTIQPVPKGACGGDIVQLVYSAAEIMAGTILWEAKRTKNWSNAWLAMPPRWYFSPPFFMPPGMPS